MAEKDFDFQKVLMISLLTLVLGGSGGAIITDQLHGKGAAPVSVESVQFEKRLIPLELKIEGLQKEVAELKQLIKDTKGKERK